MRNHLFVLAFLLVWATTVFAGPAEDLFDATNKGQTEKALALIAQGVDVNAPGNDQNTTPLMEASKQGNLELVNALLAKGATINAEDNTKGTALQYASEFSQLDVVRVLLAKGADVNINDGHMINLFLLAAAKGNIEVLQQLLARGMNVNALGQATIPGEALKAPGGKKKKHKSSKGSEINRERDATALMLGSLTGHLDVVQALLNKNATVDVRDEFGRTPLMLASEKGYSDVVQALIAANADVNAKASDNTTALTAATQNNHLDIAEILSNNHADINMQDTKGITILMQAAEQGKLDVVQLVLAHGADVNLKSFEGKTALMIASTNSHLEVMQALVTKNANVNAKDNQGVAAIDMVSYDNPAARNLLIKAGAITSTKNPDWQGVWKGQLGKQEIAACIQLDDNKFFQMGVYYYLKHRQPINLELDKDIVQADSILVLHEANGAWNLTLSNRDVLTGTWSTKNTQFALSLTRVPITNNDQTNTPCSSDEFNNGRKIKPQFVNTVGTVNGIQYRIVTDKNDTALSSFELLGTDKLTDSVNQQLRKEFSNAIDEAFECSTDMIGRSSEKAEYTSMTTPTMITKHWLSVTTHSESYCGGAYPNAGSTYRLWDLTTGKPVDLWTWVIPGPALSKLLDDRWPQKSDGGGDSGCEGVGEMASWDIHTDQTGLVFTPQLPHVVQACADDVLIPYATLQPVLSAPGKAAAKSILTDLAEQQR